MPRWGFEDRSIPDNDPAVQALQPADASRDALAVELRRAKTALGGADASQQLALRILTEQARAALAEGPEVQRKAATELKRALDLARAAEDDAESSRRLHEMAHRRSAFGYDHMVISTACRAQLQPGS